MAQVGPNRDLPCYAFSGDGVGEPCPVVTTTLAQRTGVDPSVRRHHAATVLATGLVLMGGLLAAAPLTSASATSKTSAASAASALQAKPKPAPDDYTPRGGVTFNNPLAGTDSRRAIIRHLLRTVNSVPGKQTIRIASWNIRSDELADALIEAHRRGVSVRVVMDRLNANPDNRNDTFNRMKNAFKGDDKRKPEMRSSTKRCVSSCRYGGGIAHSKFFLFSQAGKASQRRDPRLVQRHRPGFALAVERRLHRAQPPRLLRPVQPGLRPDDARPRRSSSPTSPPPRASSPPTSTPTRARAPRRTR